MYEADDMRGVQKLTSYELSLYLHEKGLSLDGTNSIRGIMIYNLLFV